MAIDSFSGKYRFLSNFYPSVVIWSSWEWPTVEHAYQAAKSPQDEAYRLACYNAETPGAVKRLGQKCKLRPDWEAKKVQIMRDLVEWKFQQHAELGNKLLATGSEELIEGNHWGDVFWGVCRGYGENHLGKILMAVRTELQGDRALGLELEED